MPRRREPRPDRPRRSRPCSTSIAHRGPTSGSGTASTSASERRSLDSKVASPSPRCSAASPISVSPSRRDTAVDPRRRPRPPRPRRAPDRRSPVVRSPTPHQHRRHQPSRKDRMTMTSNPVDNGVNTAALLGAREALSDAPEAAEFTWRATSSWVDGTYSRIHRRGLLRPRPGAPPQRRPSRSTPITRRSSRRRIAAPPPSRSCSSALASCLTAGVAAVAQIRGIQLRSVTATVEGNDERPRHPRCRSRHPQRLRRRHGTLRRSTPTPRRDELEALVAQSQKRSAVFDIMTNPTSVTVRRRRLSARPTGRCTPRP